MMRAERLKILRISTYASLAVLLVGLSEPLSVAQVPSKLKDLPLGIPGEGSARNSAQGEVEFAGPEQATIPAGKRTEVQLHFRVKDGFHINSHTPEQKTLIPTRLIVEEPHGLTVSTVDFPKGSSFTPSFAPKDTLSIYSGNFSIAADIFSRSGVHILRGGLHYQACDANACTPPRTLPFEIKILAQ
jgi:hypothetical protein